MKLTPREKTLRHLKADQLNLERESQLHLARIDKMLLWIRDTVVEELEAKPANSKFLVLTIRGINRTRRLTRLSTVSETP